MSKISRQDIKKRFKTGMYPTQQDFENVFDSYVHKDDTIDPSKIVLGDENIVDIINRKAEEKHSHEIADVDGLQKFINEMTNLLAVVRDPETGEISESKLKSLTESLAKLRDDVDTNTDNIKGHESRIKDAETNLEKVYQILGKESKETIADLADRFAALTGNYANVYSFINKVKDFLEASDASDETINRWKEIETFLQGITDTQTLTGLLENLKTEIKNEMPKGNYLEQVADLDGYTNAEDGKIVQYKGQTNEKYTHGFFYERKAGEGGEEIQVTTAPLTIYANKMELFDGEDCGDIAGEYESVDTVLKYSDYGAYGHIINHPPVVGQKIVSGGARRITEYTDDYFYPKTIEEYFSDDMIHQGKWLYRRKTDGLLIAVLETPIQSGSSVTSTIFVMADERNIKATYKFKSGVYSFGKWGDVTTESISNQPSSWQHIHIDNVIS